jgi:hypothetical protein
MGERMYTIPADMRRNARLRPVQIDPKDKLGDRCITDMQAQIGVRWCNVYRTSVAGEDPLFWVLTRGERTYLVQPKDLEEP